MVPVSTVIAVIICICMVFITAAVMHIAWGVF